MKKYYQMEQDGETLDITIYGDITSWRYAESDMSSYLLSKQIDGAKAKHINVYINSYGGEVAEGVAIYTALKRHAAEVHTYCDGFACSIASVIFMAGDMRTMYDTSMLMIHNAWTCADGNASELRKAADDLEKISEASANAYRAGVKIDDDTLQRLLDEETWLTSQESLDMGFATEIADETKNSVPAANARMALMNRILGAEAKIEGFDTTALAQEIADKVVKQMKETAENTPNGTPAGENHTQTFLNALMRGKGKKDEE